MTALEEKLRTLAQDYEPIDDPQERLSLFVDAHRRHAGLEASLRTEEARIRGCVSAAWICADLHEGTCRFRCAADSPLVEGLLAGLCAFFSGASPEAVSTSTADPLGELGLSRNLSPTRQNGLAHARRRIQELAASLIIS